MNRSIRIESGVSGFEDVHNASGSRGGDRAVSAVAPEMVMMSSEPRNRHPRDGAEQRSESGGSLWGTLFTLVGIPVGWIGYVVSVLIVANHLMDTNLSPTVLNLSPTTTFWLAVGVLVVVGFAMFVRPVLVLTGWLVMAVLLAGGAAFVFGWSQLVLVAEGITLAPLVLAVLIGMESTTDSSSSDWFLLGYFMGRRRRWWWRRW